jgi:hypothetical protein
MMRERMKLALEQRERFVLLLPANGEALERELIAGALVANAVDRAHPATADQLLHLVSASDDLDFDRILRAGTLTARLGKHSPQGIDPALNLGT